MRFKPQNRCVYCGRDDVALSDEHIVPFGIGGNDLILPQASCETCQKITGNEIEQVCLRDTFQHLRARHRYPTRNPKKRPSKFLLKASQPLDGMATEVPVEASEIPLIIAQPHFAHPPGLLIDKPPEECTEVIAYASGTNEDLDFQKKHQVNCEIRIHPDKYFRMIAKIAHCFALSQLERRSFKPLLSELILAGTPYFGYLIGASNLGVPIAAPHPQSVYDLRLSIVRLKSGIQVVCAAISLFAYLDTNDYLVVVGEWQGGIWTFPSPPAAKRLKIAS